MNIANILIEILKFTLPSLFVFLTAYYLFKAFLDREDKQANRSLRADYHKIALPLRLQAYERLALLMERITLTNVIPRVKDEYMSAGALHEAIIVAIRAEYEHNVSQQVYVSSDVWQIINLCKDETLKLVNLVAATVPNDSDANVLARSIYEQIYNSNKNIPTQNALEAIKSEISTLF